MKGKKNTKSRKSTAHPAVKILTAQKKANLLIFSSLLILESVEFHIITVMTCRFVDILTNPVYLSPLRCQERWITVVITLLKVWK